MKLSLSALFGAVYGMNEAEMFLQQEVSLATDPILQTAVIGSGHCQAMFGGDIIDLKPFDQQNRDMHKMTAAI